MKRYIILDLDGTLIDSESTLGNDILDLFEKHKPEYADTVRYIGNSLNGIGYREYLSKIFKEEDDINFMEAEILKLLQTYSDSPRFFDKAIETVKELSLNYTLFLSTGAYTDYATKVLKNGGINHLFAHIQGSEVHTKSPKHIEIFKDVTLDPEFEIYAISVGDGEIEKGVALACGIDFIQVGKNYPHDHIINHIGEFPEYLKKLSNIDSLEIGEQNYIL